METRKSSDFLILSVETYREIQKANVLTDNDMAKKKSLYNNISDTQLELLLHSLSDKENNMPQFYGAYVKPSEEESAAKEEVKEVLVPQKKKITRAKKPKLLHKIASLGWLTPVIGKIGGELGQLG